MDQKKFMAKWKRVTERNCHVASFYVLADDKVDLLFLKVVSENPESSHQVVYDRKQFNMVCDCEDFKHRGPCCIHMMAAALFYVGCNWTFHQFSFQNDLEDAQKELEEGIPNKIRKFSPLLWALAYGDEPAISEEEKNALRVEPPAPATPRNANGVAPSQPEEPTEPPEPVETLSQIIEEVGDQLGEEVDVTLVIKRTIALPRGGWLHLGAEEMKFHLPLTSLPLLHRIEKALLAELADLSAGPEVAQLMGQQTGRTRPSRPKAGGQRAAARPTQATPPEEADEDVEKQAGQDYSGEEGDIGQFWGN